MGFLHGILSGVYKGSAEALGVSGRGFGGMLEHNYREPPAVETLVEPRQSGGVTPEKL